MTALRDHVVRVLREWAAAGTPVRGRGAEAQRQPDSNSDSDEDGVPSGESKEGGGEQQQQHRGVAATPPARARPPAAHLRRMPDMVRMLLQVSARPLAESA